MIRFFLRRPLAITSLIVLGILYVVMLFAEFIAPYAAVTSFPGHTYAPPNVRFMARNGSLVQAQEMRVINPSIWQYAHVRGMYHPVKLFGKGEPYKLWGIIPLERHLFAADYPLFLFGADNLGRDLFSRMVHGSRISLTIGFAATAISLFLAILIGGIAGYYGGFADWLSMRGSEFFMLIPGLYLILFLRSLLSSKMDTGQSYMIITLILSLVGWPGSARTIRGMVHAIKREEFILNAQVEGIPPFVIIFAHIIPQIASLLIVSVALSVPAFIMSETTLSYLGLGITDPAVSWGSLIKREISTINNLKNYPWLLDPVWLLLVVTLAFNFVGDALRDYFDPYHTLMPKFSLKKVLAVLRAKKNSPSANKANYMQPASRDSNADRDTLAGEKMPDAPPTPKANTLLSVKNLVVTFASPALESPDIQAVRGVSFNLARGEILGIVGESGSGKSVAVSAIPGLLPANAVISGSICLNDAELSGKSPEQMRAYRGKKIGVIFQEPGRSYDPLQRIGSVFCESFRAFDSITREESDRRAAQLLEETGITGAKKRLQGFPHQFSGGQLQRIGIALALSQNCELLIADEPTTALDVTIQAQIVSLLKEIRDNRKIAIVFISHNIDVVASIADRIQVMYAGLIMESGSTHEILNTPRHPYTKALLEAAPRFGRHYSQSNLISIPGKVPDPRAPHSGCPFEPRCFIAQKGKCSAATGTIPALQSDASGSQHLSRCFL